MRDSSPMKPHGRIVVSRDFPDVGMHGRGPNGVEIFIGVLTGAVISFGFWLMG